MSRLWHYRPVPQPIDASYCAKLFMTMSHSTVKARACMHMLPIFQQTWKQQLSTCTTRVANFQVNEVGMVRRWQTFSVPEAANMYQSWRATKHATKLNKHFCPTVSQFKTRNVLYIFLTSMATNTDRYTINSKGLQKSYNHDKHQSAFMFMTI